MRYLSSVSIAAGLLVCLGTTPARADLATPDAGSAEAPAGQVSDALQALTSIVDAAAAVPANSGLASDTKSTGPVSAPFTSMGIDSSNGPVSSAALAASVGSAGFFSMSLTPVSAEPSLAAPPAGLLQGVGGQAVGTPSAPATDLSSMSASISTPLLSNGSSLVANDAAPVPIPAAFLLLGGGLIGIWPLRRSTRLSLAL